MTGRRHAMEFERPLVELEEKLEGLRELDVTQEPELAQEIERLAVEVEELKESLYTDLTPWQKVQVSRHPDRPKSQDYLAQIFDDVVELRGDRAFKDDRAMIAALATLKGRRVVVVGHRKGRTTRENLESNFGMPHPEGFRKAMRAMRLADKFGLPLVGFVDTQGAYPGVEAEERGQAWAIAESLALLGGLRVPVVVVGIGEGGSGGALAVGFGDRLIMLENAYYSVSTPEACAAILHTDASRAEETSEALSLTAQKLDGLGLVDAIVEEPRGGAHQDPSVAYRGVESAVAAALDELAAEDPDALVASRYAKLRRVGEHVEEAGGPVAGNG